MKFWRLASSSMMAAAAIGAMSARLLHPAAPPQLAEPPLRLKPSEIKIYKGAETLIDWTPAQIRNCAFLHKLQPPGSPDQLPALLDRIGQTVTLLFHDFPQIACDETIFSEASPGMPLVTSLHQFNYIVIPQPGGDAPAFDEYRTDLNGNPLGASSLRDFSMITSNFASNWLYLSPADQQRSRFRYFGTQTIRNRECHVVGFAQDPERARSGGGFFIDGKSVVVLLQGLAWVDSQTFQVLRITTWLLAPRTDIGLTSQDSTVDFYPVQPRGFEGVLWLPRDVKVRIIYQGFHVRNTHQYSNFKLFRVKSTIKPGE
ncbi:MAG TPA: hypothetical protein VKO18_15445 [Terriglobia bacterium]|nr:hypothetical protein [Terriglobia bacterium]